MQGLSCILKAFLIWICTFRHFSHIHAKSTKLHLLVRCIPHDMQRIRKYYIFINIYCLYARSPDFAWGAGRVAAHNSRGCKQEQGQAFVLVHYPRPNESCVAGRPLSWKLLPSRLFRRLIWPGGSWPHGCGCCSFLFNNKHERRSKH